MQYRNLSECMTKEEVETLMGFLLPGSIVTELNRLKDLNCINVSFELDGQEGILIFYPDDIDNIPEGFALANQNMYQVYMIVNGYSSIWDQGMGSDMKTGECFMRARNMMEERRIEQLESDSILKELMEASDKAGNDLNQGTETDDFRKKLENYLLIEGKLKERLEHISYVAGIADALAMLRVMDHQVTIPHLAAELENLLLDYKNLHGLLEAFGDGAKVQLGDYDVTQGIYAVSSALDEKNRKLEALFERALGNEIL